MNDRELLELAAKAADLVATPEGDVLLPAGPATGECRRWNPLTDDGDALRLAVKVGLEVSCDGAEKVIVGWPDPHHPASGEEHTFYSHVMESKGSDPAAACRRAIVRAAAALGSVEHGSGG